MNVQFFQAYELDSAYYAIQGYDYLDACILERNGKRRYSLSFFVSFKDCPPTSSINGVWTQNSITVNFTRIVDAIKFHERVVCSGIELTDPELREIPEV